MVQPLKSRTNCEPYTVALARMLCPLLSRRGMVLFANSTTLLGISPSLSAYVLLLTVYPSRKHFAPCMSMLIVVSCYYHLFSQLLRTSPLRSLPSIPNTVALLLYVLHLLQFLIVVPLPASSPPPASTDITS
jgi:hypothetical protein